jgi:hypothetical protein
MGPLGRKERRFNRAFNRAKFAIEALFPVAACACPSCIRKSIPPLGELALAGSVFHARQQQHRFDNRKETTP